MGIQENLGMDPPQGRTGRKILRGHYSFQYLPNGKSLGKCGFDRAVFQDFFGYLEPGSVTRSGVNKSHGVFLTSKSMQIAPVSTENICWTWSHNSQVETIWQCVKTLYPW